VAVDGSQQPRGSIVIGEVRLEGGAVAQHVNLLSVKLVDHLSGNRSEVRLLDERVVAGNLNVEPGSHHSFPYQLELPDDAAIRSVVSTGCRIDADADISWAVNPRCSVNLNVTPHLEVQAIHSAMRKLGFMKNHAALPVAFSYGDRSRQTPRSYRPPMELAELMDGVIITLEVLEDKVVGHLYFDPKETSVGEKLRAIVSVDYRSFGIDFRRTELLMPSGKPNPEGAIPRLKEVIEDSRIRFAEENSHLLRPADAPKEEILLRSASATKPSNPEELLRPATREPRK
jgi:hypothetical protein